MHHPQEPAVCLSGFLENLSLFLDLTSPPPTTTTLSLSLSRANDVGSFKRNLDLLTSFDRATARFRPVNFFHSYHALEVDLLDIFRLESAACSGDMKQVLLKGHGLVGSISSTVGPCVTYFASPLTLLSTGFSEEVAARVSQDPSPCEGFFRAHFDIEQGTVEVHHIDTSRTQYFEKDPAKFQESPAEVKE